MNFLLSEGDTRNPTTSPNKRSGLAVRGLVANMPRLGRHEVPQSFEFLPHPLLQFD